MHRASPQPRSAYRWFREISTQWKDNDVYGHINNAVHYTWFDTTVNAW
jgi:acyl-CoA thioester hydrolase